MPVFGFRAAGPALLSNVSYFEQRVCTWDPQTMTLSAERTAHANKYSDRHSSAPAAWAAAIPSTPASIAGVKLVAVRRHLRWPPHSRPRAMGARICSPPATTAKFWRAPMWTP